MASIYYKISSPTIYIANSASAAGAYNAWSGGPLCSGYNVIIKGTSFKLPSMPTELFYGAKSIMFDNVNMTWNDVDTSDCVTFQSLFEKASSIGGWLDISKWNTSKVTDMRNMFHGCTGIYDVNASGWDTSKVTSFYQTFQGCTGLTYLDITNWTALSVNNSLGFRNTFGGCSKLRQIKAEEGTDWAAQAADPDVDDAWMFEGDTLLQNYTAGDVGKNRANTVKNYGYFTGVFVRKKCQPYEKVNNTWVEADLKIKDSDNWTNTEVYL